MKSFNSDEILEEHDFRTIYKTPNISVEIPKSFDAREKWNNCSSIGQVFEQGCCISDWVITDILNEIVFVFNRIISRDLIVIFIDLGANH